MVVARSKELRFQSQNHEIIPQTREIKRWRNEKGALELLDSSGRTSRQYSSKWLHWANTGSTASAKPNANTAYRADAEPGTNASSRRWH
jgi:hypothetical protein